MLSVTVPVTTIPSACRGEATNSTPKRLKSNTTFPRATSSASQPLQPPAETCRSLRDRPKSRRIFESSAWARGYSPSVRTNDSRVLAARRWSVV